MTPYYVYIILCEGNKYYTGYTKNVNTRLRLHKNGKGAKYTKIHKPKRIVYIEKLNSRSEAMKREKRIKKLTHNQKRTLTKRYAKTERKPKNTRTD